MLCDALSCPEPVLGATTRCTTICSLLECALSVTAGYKALRTMDPHLLAYCCVSDDVETASSKAVEELGYYRMDNTCELSFEPS